MKNLYVHIPNSQAATDWIQEKRASIRNIGGNEVIVPRYHPDEENHPFELVHEIELSEDSYNLMLVDLTNLNAAQGLTKAQFHAKYPPKPPLTEPI